MNKPWLTLLPVVVVVYYAFSRPHSALNLLGLAVSSGRKVFH